MTSIARGVPCQDAGSTLPTDAKVWGNQANAEISGLWDYASVPLTVQVGSVNTIVATSAVPIPSYKTGMNWTLQPLNNTTNAATINIDGKGALSILDRDGGAPNQGGLIGGRLYRIFYVAGAIRIQDIIFPTLQDGNFPTGYIGGLRCDVNVSTPFTAITVQLGSARDATDAFNIRAASAISKQMNNVWAAGNNQGGQLVSTPIPGTITVSGTSVTGSGTNFTVDFNVGLTITTAGGQCRRITVISSNTSMTVESAWGSTETGVTYKRGGLAKNTCYRVFLLRKDSDGSGDIAFSPADIPSDIPAGYSTKVRIWFLLTDSSANIIQFIQHRRKCELTVPIVDFTHTTTTTATILTSAPPGVLAHMFVTAVASTGSHVDSVQSDSSASLKIGNTTQTLASLAQVVEADNTNYIDTIALAGSLSTIVNIRACSMVGATPHDVLIDGAQHYLAASTITLTGSSSSGATGCRLIGWTDPS